MNNPVMPWVWTLALVALLAGCSSSPRSNYYLLTAKHGAAPTGAEHSLGIGPIEIPEYLNRSNMVYNRQGNKLQVANLDSWAEPLDEGVKRVMAINLAQLLNTHEVRSFPWHPKRAPDYGVQLNILALDANEQEATLAAEWLVYRTTDAEPVQRRISLLHQPMPAGELKPGDVASAYSALLLQLSELIAKVIIADAEQ
jgi:uncharacterized lipoprotein YmbA